MTVDEWRGGPGKETETSFGNWLIGYARTQAWRITHFRPAQTAQGWRTALQGHRGFVDLVLAREGETIHAELKVGRNMPDDDQWAWLIWLASTPGAEVYIWRPQHRPFIEQRLQRRPQDHRGQVVLPPYLVDTHGRVHVDDPSQRSPHQEGAHG
jgi:hypothetical protein